MKLLLIFGGCSLFSSSKSLGVRPSKASSVGAKMVKEPSCFSRPVKPASSIRDRKILQSKQNCMKQAFWPAAGFSKGGSFNTKAGPIFPTELKANALLISNRIIVADRLEFILAGPVWSRWVTQLLYSTSACEPGRHVGFLLKLS